MRVAKTREGFETREEKVLKMKMMADSTRDPINQWNKQRMLHFTLVDHCHSSRMILSFLTKKKKKAKLVVLVVETGLNQNVLTTF